jgi:hypothetical protein
LDDKKKDKKRNECIGRGELPRNNESCYILKRIKAKHEECNAVMTRMMPIEEAQMCVLEIPMMGRSRNQP